MEEYGILDKKDYDTIKGNIFNEINDINDWNNQFEIILSALKVSRYEDGKYKSMHDFLGDITIAYLIYHHDLYGAKFSGL